MEFVVGRLGKSEASGSLAVHAFVARLLVACETSNYAKIRLLAGCILHVEVVQTAAESGFHLDCAWNLEPLLN